MSGFSFYAPGFYNGSKKFKGNLFLYFFFLKEEKLRVVWLKKKVMDKFIETLSRNWTLIALSPGLHTLIEREREAHGRTVCRRIVP